MREPTKEQRAVLVSLRSTYGNDVVKASAPNPKTGMQTMRLTCALGAWLWDFDTEGRLRSASLEQGLFQLPPQTVKKRNALDI